MEPSVEPSQIDLERHRNIQLKAYSLWQERGCPIGEPELDWFRAEEQWHGLNPDLLEKSAIVVAAEVVGSALGTVAGFVASVTNLVHPDERSEPDSEPK